MFKSKRELRADNRRPRWENEDLRKQKDTLKDEVSVYRQKIECATGHVNINPLIKTVEALCTNPEYDKWANHPAATILVRLSSAQHLLRICAAEMDPGGDGSHARATLSNSRSSWRMRST